MTGTKNQSSQLRSGHTKVRRSTRVSLIFQKMIIMMVFEQWATCRISVNTSYSRGNLDKRILSFPSVILPVNRIESSEMSLIKASFIPYSCSDIQKYFKIGQFLRLSNLLYEVILLFNKNFVKIQTKFLTVFQLKTVDRYKTSFISRKKWISNFNGFMEVFLWNSFMETYNKGLYSYSITI